MRVMPLLHSLRYETNFRAYPQLGIVKPESIVTPIPSGNSTDNPTGASAAPNAAAAPTGLAGLALRLGDGLDHLRFASAQLMQQLDGAATAAAAAAKSPETECDPKLVIEHLARMF